MLVASNDNPQLQPITSPCVIRAVREVMAALRASEREAYRMGVAGLCSAGRECLERYERREGLTRRAHEYLRD